ncbi:hypothetical protein L5220_09845 [Synechococcus sp. PCC 6716]|nr:hypothetical protein [Synechococcus sp. PCC 6716]
MKVNRQNVVVAIALIVSLSGALVVPVAVGQSGGGLLTAAQMQKLNLSVTQKQALLRLTMKTNERILGILDSNQQRLFRNAIKQGKSTGEAMDMVALRPEQKTQMNKVMQDTQAEMLTILTTEQVKQLKGSR